MAHALVFSDSLRTVGLSVQTEKVLLTSFRRYICHSYLHIELYLVIQVLLFFYFLLLQVISTKDQAQYWCYAYKPYSYVSVDQFAKKFKDFHLGHKLDEELSNTFDKSHSHKNSLSFRPYSLTKWELFKACTRREFLLMKRNYFIYVFKSTQVDLFV